MEFQKISSPSLRELFVEQLENMILSGTLQIGEKLPPERQLAEVMQVSRAVVNGGIRELEEKGFLVIKPRSGTYVADYRKYGTIDTLMTIMKYNGGRFRDEEIRSIFEVREALDSLIVNLCIDKLTDEELDHLHEKIEGIRHSRNHHDIIENAFEFQHELALYSGNALVPLLFQSFKPSTFRLWERFISLYGVDRLYDSNMEMWTRLKNRDKEGALEIVKKICRNCIEGETQLYY